jgi:hypothetical protein
MARVERGRGTVALPAGVVAALVVLAAACLQPSPALAAGSMRTSTLYSTAVSEQYINNADDRARGKGANPFGNFKDVNPTVKQPLGVPFPGDQAIYKFNLYTTNALSNQAGTATLICYYNFDHNAFCDAQYTLPGGVLFGSAAFDFDASSFDIAITGGSGRYVRATGGILVTPGPKHSQHLALTLS